MQCQWTNVIWTIWSANSAVFYWKQLTLSNMEFFIHYFLSLSPASISSLCVYLGPKTSLSDESLQTSQLYILSQMCFITSSLPSNGCVKIPCNCLPFWEGETDFLLGSTCSIKQCCQRITFQDPIKNTLHHLVPDWICCPDIVFRRRLASAVCWRVPVTETRACIMLTVLCKCVCSCSLCIHLWLCTVHTIFIQYCVKFLSC